VKPDGLTARGTSSLRPWGEILSESPAPRPKPFDQDSAWKSRARPERAKQVEGGQNGTQGVGGELHIFLAAADEVANQSDV